jgi:hypothetical protein
MKVLIPFVATAMLGFAWGLAPASAASEKAHIAEPSKVDEVSANGRRSRRVAYVQRQVVPRACSAVVFPRNPVCGIQLVTFGPYSAFPY